MSPVKKESIGDKIYKGSALMLLGACTFFLQNIYTGIQSYEQRVQALEVHVGRMEGKMDQFISNITSFENRKQRLEEEKNKQ